MLEHLGVLLPRFQLVEQLDLAVDEGLVAAGQVDVEVADPLLEQGGLLGGHVDGHRLHDVEGLSEVAELVVGSHLDRLEGGGEVVLIVVHRVAEGVDQLGQPLLGQVVGGLGELAQRSGDGPGGGQR